MIAYFDCFSGISGDMTLGAFIDLGVDPNRLSDALCSCLPKVEFDIRSSWVKRSGISACRVIVEASDKIPRNYAQIRGLIEESLLPGRVKTASLEMFGRVARAEAAIHACPVDKVHFHELGGVDAIVDMVGAAICVDFLGIDRLFASKIPLGSGMVECSHGMIPVPAPATMAILTGVPVYGGVIEGEAVTPTGAAIVTTLAGEFGAVPDMIVEKTGYGAGQRDGGPNPNLLRIILGHEAVGKNVSMVMVETTIDDMNPELFGYLGERLFENGAADVTLIPAYMKKGRPGTLVQALCPDAVREKIVYTILSESSSIGVRFYPVMRTVLDRVAVTLKTPHGPIMAKAVKTPDGRVRISPEYASCRKTAESRHLPLPVVYQAALAAAEDQDMTKIR
ncbi:MAG: nickel pincer cofactor biosynthesis protein LarC [Deltaproteobacteria bacterium]|nr:nickel pincer cofactor biosynthesis protein LarC [Deltaproteobacteria bacterium]